MLKNHIKESLIINKSSVQDIPGKRLYFNKLNVAVSVIFTFSILLMILSLIIIAKGENITIFLSILGSLFMGYFFQENLAKLIFRNPVLILYTDRIYSTINERWYLIEACQIDDKQMGKLTWELSFCIEDGKNSRFFLEKNWHLKDVEEFKSILSHNLRLLKAGV